MTRNHPGIGACPKTFSMLENSVIALLVTFIFCLPFPHMTAVTNITFYLALATVLLLAAFKRIELTFVTPLTLPLVLFLLWSGLSAFWSLNRDNSLHDVRAHLLNHVILYFLLINTFVSKRKLTLLAWTVVTSAAAFSLVGTLYYYVIMDNPIHETRFGYLLSNSVNWSTELPVNFIGTVTVFAVILSLHLFAFEVRPYRRVAIIACLLPIVAATVMTQSKGTLIALIVTAPVYLSLKTRKILPVVVFVVISLLAFLPMHDKIDLQSFKERLKINYFTLEVIKDYPAAGIGFGMQTFVHNIDRNLYMKKLPAEYRPEAVLTPHNLLLDITVRLGLIGLALFLVILFLFGKISMKTIRSARDEETRSLAKCIAVSFVGYLIISIAEPVFLFAASAAMFYILLAMMTILWRLNNSNDAAGNSRTDDGRSGWEMA